MLKQLKDIECEYCGKIFSPRSSKRKFCSAECSQKSRIILREHICEQCGKKFMSKKREQKYCGVDCQSNSYKNIIKCEICGIDFNPDIHGQRICRSCKPKRESLDDVKCLACGKLFHPKQRGRMYCSNKCKYIARITLKDVICPICGKTFHQTDKESTYCSKDCFHKSDARRTIPNKITRPNIHCKEMLCGLGYDVILEKPIGNKTYDIGVGNIVIEINPWAYHNSTRAPYNNMKPKQNNYHQIRMRYTVDNGYKCIMVWDWTTDDEIIKMIEDT